MFSEKMNCLLSLNYQKMIKSLVALYSNKLFHVAGAKIIRDNKSGHNSKQRQNFRTGMKKNTKI